MAPSPVHADGPVVALIETTTAPREGRQELKAVVEQALRDLGAEVLPQAKLRDLSAVCEEPGCYAKIGAATGARFILRVDGTYQTQAYRLHLELHDGGTGALIAEDNNQCDICTLSDFQRAAKERATLLCARPLRAGGASVPSTGAAPPAPTPGSTAAAASAPVAPRSLWSAPVPMAGVAIGLLGLGVAGAGVRLLAIDGDSACGAGDAKPCARFRATGTAGRILVAGGLAAALAGVATIYWGRDAPSRTSVAMVIVEGSARLILGGRF